MTAASKTRIQTFTQSLQHSLAYLVRKRDAEVTFKWQVFVAEVVYNLLGYLILPIIWVRHSWVGAYNRQYIGLRSWFQLTNIALYVAANVLFAVWHHREGFYVTMYELLIMNFLNLLRALTIAGKYSFYTDAELAQLDKVVLSGAQISEKLILGGWSRPTLHLLFMEMERSVTRNAPHLARLNVVFPDAASRDATLYAMAECLPSYNEYELCAPDEITVKVHTLSGVVKTAARKVAAASSAAVRRGRAAAAAATAATAGAGAGAASPKQRAVTPLPSTPLANTPSAALLPAGSPVVDGATAPVLPPPTPTAEAISPAVSPLAEPDDGGQASPVAGGDGDAEVCLLTSAMDPVDVFLRLVHPSSISSAGQGAPDFADAPGVDADGGGNAKSGLRQSAEQQRQYEYAGAASSVGGEDVEGPATPQTLPSLPAKLFLWHLLYKVHYKRPVKTYALASVVASIVFLVLPLAIRGGFGSYTEDWRSALVLALVLQQATFYFFNTLSFVLAGVLDHSRRVELAQHLYHLIDPNALIALRMHDANEDETEPAIVVDDPEAEDRLRHVGSSADMQQGQDAAPSNPENGGVTTGSSGRSTPLPLPPASSSQSIGSRRPLPAGVQRLADESSVDSSFRNASTTTSSQGQSTRRRLVTPAGDGASSVTAGGASMSAGKGAGPAVGRLRAVQSRALHHDLRHMDIHPVHEDVGYQGVLAATIRASYGVTDADADAELAACELAMDADAAGTGAGISGGPGARSAGPCRGRGYGCGRPDCVNCQGRRIHAVSRKVRASMVARHALLSPDQVHRLIMAPSQARISLPIFYPQNLVVWGHLNHSALDFGRSFNYRIGVYTAFFGFFVFLEVLFLFVYLASHPEKSAESVIVIGHVCLTEVVFGSVLALQIIQAARANRMRVHHTRRLVKIETMVLEYVTAASSALPAIIKERLLQSKKVAYTTSHALVIEDKIAPSRVMGVPAGFALLGTMASVTLSGVIAAYSALKAF